MARFYTLDEAALVLGMSPEELKVKAQSREVRAFLDGGSWRFRVVDIDELARHRGMGSDPELRLSDLEIPVVTDKQEGAAEDILSGSEIGVAQPDLRPQTIDLPHPSGSGSDHDLLIEERTLPPVSGSSSVIIGMEHTGGKLPGDSDVRLVPDNLKGASDSDVRLAAPSFKPPSDSDVTLIADDTSKHDVVRPGLGDTAVRQSPVFGEPSSAEVSIPGDSDFELSPSSEVEALQPNAGSDFELSPSSEVAALQPNAGSDFELSPSSGVEALQPDSGSDFELSAIEESSDEFEATPLIGPSDSDVTAADPGFSGINLSRPSDSGINLQVASGFDLSDSIELAPLSTDLINTVKPPPPYPASPAQPPAVRKGGEELFDDTDFEIDAFDSSGGSGNKTIQLESASDFDLEESDTGSEVFAIEEEDVDHNAATAMGPAIFDQEEEEIDPFEAASGELVSAWGVESEGATSAERAAPAAVLAPSAAAPEWGGLWIGFLAVTTVFMLFLAFVSMDLVRNLYEFRGDGPASGIVKSLAGLLGG